MPEIEAIGGWLKDADESLDRRYRRLEDIAPAAFAPERLAYFEDYRARYFNDALIPGQGVEPILETLARHGGAPNHWVDLGAGVTTLFWAIGVNAPRAVSACDLVPEALHVLSRFKASEELPPCYEDALRLMDRSRADFDAVRRLDWTYHVVDGLAPWSIPGGGIDLITAIGCFGLAASPALYLQAFAAAAANLAPGGRLIGVDWIRSALFVEREGHDNRYLGDALTAECGARATLKPLSLATVSIAGDDFYDSLIVWAFERAR
jgi:SAM-dependent methyltransferase